MPVTIMAHCNPVNRELAIQLINRDHIRATQSEQERLCQHPRVTVPEGTSVPGDNNWGIEINTSCQTMKFKLRIIIIKIIIKKIQHKLTNKSNQ
jgi:hypothetical protein